MNIFETTPRKKFLTKKRMLFWGFYGPLLYSFALLLAGGKYDNDLCFFNIFCVPSNGNIWAKAFVIYLYLLSFALLIIYVYKGVESLVKRKNHIRVFQWILLVLPIGFTAIIWWNEPVFQGKHYFFITLFAVLSITGLAMIEFRKKN
jgi:hypothetical protein